MQREQQISNCYVNLWLFRHWLDSRFFSVCDDDAAHITFLSLLFFFMKQEESQHLSAIVSPAGIWLLAISIPFLFLSLSFPFPAGCYKDFGQNWDPSITGTPLCATYDTPRSEPISGLMMDRRLDKVLLLLFLSFFWATGASKKERKKMCCKTQTYGSIQSSPRTYIYTPPHSQPPSSSVVCGWVCLFLSVRPRRNAPGMFLSLCVCVCEPKEKKKSLVDWLLS